MKWTRQGRHHVMLAVSVASAALLVSLAACARSPASPTVSSDPKDAPDSVRVAGKTVTLKASLTRDFMPIAPIDGRPLMAVLTVTTVDQTPFPAGVTADRAWVFYAGLTWETTVAQEGQRPADAPSLEVVARDGPKWGPQAEVDVVVRLWDSRGHEYLVQAKRQTIKATF